MSSRPNQFLGLFSRLFRALIVVGVVFVLIVVAEKAHQGYLMRQEAKALELRIEDLRKENRRLNGQIDYIKSDEYIEKVAREELGLVRPGDVSVVVVSPDGGSPSNPGAIPTPMPTSTPTTDRPAATWQKWLSMFVGKE